MKCPNCGHDVDLTGASGSYEFSHKDHRLIGGLAGKMHFVGVFLIVVAVMECAAGVIDWGRDQGGLLNIVSGLFCIVIGLWTRQAGKSFHVILKSEGSRMQNLMDALADLRKLYTLYYWLVILAMFVFVIAGIVVLSSLGAG